MTRLPFVPLHIVFKRVNLGYIESVLSMKMHCNDIAQLARAECVLNSVAYTYLRRNLNSHFLMSLPAANGLPAASFPGATWSNPPLFAGAISA